MTARHLYTFGLFALALHCSAQNSKPDTTFLSSARAHRIEVYNQAIKGQSRLYNGTEYRDYLSQNEEHPYFGVDDWAYGYIMYDDEYYENVAMFYDISRDRVISEHILTGAKIELAAEKVSRFSLGDHAFVRLHNDPDRVIENGFYEVLHDGKTKLYARRQKFLQTKAESNTLVAHFEEKNRLYIAKGGVYHPVRSKGSILEVLKDKKPELKAFINENKLNFKTNRERAMAQIAEYYDAQTK